MLFDSETAKGAGRASGEARRRKARQRLTPDRLLEELPVLDSAEHAQRRLALISNSGIAGTLSAAMVGAQERVHREWREQHAFEIDRRRMKALETRVKELEGELAQRGGLRRVR